MKTKPSSKGATIMFLTMASLFGASCAVPPARAGDIPLPAIDVPVEAGETVRKSVVASGCFWCSEAVFENVAGVSDVVSGYAGDTKENATYEKVGAGRTRHAEAIEITYDPNMVTYGTLLRAFFATHDPTTKDRQGPDRGPQYRSAIFYANEDERKVAEAYIKQLDDAKVFGAPIVTTLEPIKSGQFYVAEGYHQDFARGNPAHPYIRQNVPDKLKKLEKLLDSGKMQIPTGAME